MPFIAPDVGFVQGLSDLPSTAPLFTPSFYLLDNINEHILLKYNSIDKLLRTKRSRLLRRYDCKQWPRAETYLDYVPLDYKGEFRDAFNNDFGLMSQWENG